jgi:hypothetical protein
MIADKMKKIISDGAFFVRFPSLALTATIISLFVDERCSGRLHLPLHLKAACSPPYQKHPLRIAIHHVNRFSLDNFLFAC